jgi:hypothetical protein
VIQSFVHRNKCRILGMVEEKRERETGVTQEVSAKRARGE